MIIIIILSFVLSVVITDISFGGGGLFQPVHLDDVQCTGTEPNLLNCSHNVVGVNDCNGHKEDVGIICERSQGTVMTIIYYRIAGNLARNLIWWFGGSTALPPN